MIDARYSTLDQRPEAFNAVSMDIATHILFVMVANSEMLVANPRHCVVGRELIGKEGSVPVNIMDCERNNGMSLNIVNHLSHNLAVPLGSAYNLRLALSATPTLATPHTTNIGLIYFNFSCKMLEIVVKKCADLLEHSPCGFVGNASFSFNLLGRYATPCRSYQVDSLKPYSKRSAGLMEDGIGKRGYLMPASVALVNWSSVYPVMLGYFLAYWALNAIRVAMVLNPLKASLIIGEGFVKVFSRKFVHFFIPFYHVLYHTSYMMSRDSYLKLFILSAVSIYSFTFIVIELGSPAIVLCISLYKVE